MSTRKRHDCRRAATGVARLGSVRLLTELGPRRGPGSYGRVLTGLARLHVANPAGDPRPRRPTLTYTAKSSCSCSAPACGAPKLERPTRTDAESWRLLVGPFRPRSGTSREPRRRNP